MKRLITFVFFLASISFASCNKDEASNYYIRYNVSLSYGQRSTIHLTNEYKDTETINIVGPLQRTIGPVTANFTALISSTSGELTIECCRGNEPFVQKASGTGEISYKIDY